MQTHLPAALLATDRGRTADAILRACVHCGFCNATCPTYGVLGDERDGPRGRIYLIKQLLEDGQGAASARTHLDRCLTCRACETTCPSGVRYDELLDIGRDVVEAAAPRSRFDRLVRYLLVNVVGRAALFGPLVRIGRAMRGLLPAALARKVPPESVGGAWPEARHARRVLLLQGCAQEAATPDVNLHLARLLDANGISAVPARGCCGALPHHLAREADAWTHLATNLRAWGPHLDGVEAVLSSASGCGVHVKDYGRLARGAAHASEGERELAATLAVRTLDIAEYLQRIELAPAARPRRVAWHPPCTLQHGQKITGVVERLLTDAGHTLVRVRDSHLCCGSAGTYSVLQPALANELGANKLARLLEDEPEVIATANVGCQLHLAAASAPGGPPVVHWLSLLR